jgi:NAD(P)-dependent dehydrogenase (short-subunit alcohol dehydrogenase family)
MEKNILVIGGTSGIGKQVVADILADGYKVIATSRNPEKESTDQGVELQYFNAAHDEELSIPESLSGLVYCPGTIKLQPFKRIKVDDFREDLEVNFLGAVKVLQQAMPALVKGEGSVVLFSTVAVQTGMPYHSSIAAAKGAIEGMARSLAAEYAPKVRINVIAPSLTDTPLAENLLSNEKKREANAQRHPLKKVGTTEDISNLVKYLLTPQSGWVTGQVFKIDGGLSSLRLL